MEKKLRWPKEFKKERKNELLIKLASIYLYIYV